MADNSDTSLRDRIDAVEEAFEYMLAYANQGREEEDKSEDSGIRAFLSRAADALDGVHETAADAAAQLEPDQAIWQSYLAILEEDAARARTFILFTLAQPNLSSETVDNLNTTNHMRTVLTDLFLLDSAFQSHQSG